MKSEKDAKKSKKSEKDKEKDKDKKDKDKKKSKSVSEPSKEKKKDLDEVSVKSKLKKETLKDIDSLEQDIKKASGSKVIPKIGKYTAKVVKLSQNLVDQGQFQNARDVLKRCLQYVKEQEESDVISLFKLNNAFAHLENASENVNDSLAYLEAAIMLANKFNASHNDPIAFTPAETYLNASNASMFLLRHQEALQYAEMADRSSQITLMALSQQNGGLSSKEAEKIRMQQVDILIMSHLAKAAPLERLGQFQRSFQELDKGQKILVQNFGDAHPLNSEFDTLREQIEEQRKYSRGPLDNEADHDGIDHRSELMKRGRIKRTYYSIQDYVVNQDKRAEYHEFDEPEDNKGSHKDLHKSHSKHENIVTETMKDGTLHVVIKGCQPNQQCDTEFAQQLMQTRQMQDEQFRMMELMIETQPREKRNHYVVPVFDQESESFSSSSSSSSPSSSSQSSQKSSKKSSKKHSSSSSSKKDSSESSDCSFEDEYEDFVFSKEHKWDTIKLDPRPRTFQVTCEREREEKVRSAGLDYFMFDEVDFVINPPRRPVDLKRWVHSRMLRWRFLKWRHWKREFHNVAHTEGASPHIVAWFFKRYDQGQVAEIRVYQKRLLHKKEITIKQIETTQKFVEKHQIDANENDHLLSRQKVGTNTFVKGQEVQTESVMTIGYQIYARDIRTFVKNVAEWNPLIQAYEDLRMEVKRAIQNRKQKAAGNEVRKWEDPNIVKSEAIKVRVKEHLVIDYVYSAITLVSIGQKLTKVLFNKLSYQNSIRISLRYHAWKFWFMLGRDAKNAFNNIDESYKSDSESDVFQPEDETIDTFEEATIDLTKYNEIQKRMKELRARVNFNEKDKRLSIQHQARMLLEQRKKQGPIKYIVDHTLRGTQAVEPIIIRSKININDEFKSGMHAALVILKAYKAWRMRCNLSKIWTLVHTIEVPREQCHYDLEVYQRNKPDQKLRNCRLRLLEKHRNQCFNQYMSKLPLPESGLKQLTERDVFIGKDINEQITDVQICLNKPKLEPFLFIEGYSYPPQLESGSFEICRIQVTSQIAVRLIVQQRATRKSHAIESLFVYSKELQKTGDILQLPEQLPVMLRYMRYFLRDHVNINYIDGRLGKIRIEDWDDTQFGIFMSKMRREEDALRKIKDQERRDKLADDLRQKIDQRVNENVITDWREAWIRPDRNHIQRFSHKYTGVGKEEHQLYRLTKKGERKQDDWIGPYFIQVIKGGIKAQKDAITVIVAEEDHKEYITINKLDQKLIADVPKLRTEIEDNLGFYLLHHPHNRIAYLAMYGLKQEPALKEVYEEEPEFDHEFDALVAQAQAIWRGTNQRNIIAKDRKNLVVRFWKVAENSRARISVRKLKVKRSHQTVTREVEETTQITSFFQDGAAVNNNNVSERKEVKVGKEDVQVRSEVSDAYKVEVEDAQTFDDHDLMVKFTSLTNKAESEKYFFSEQMPSREIALEWFRMAVYVWWKKRPQNEQIGLHKYVMNKYGELEQVEVSKTLNTYKVDGFSVHRPENFQVDMINQKREKLLQALKIKEIRIQEIIEESIWFAKTVWIDGQIVYVLSQSDASKLDDKFIKIEVFTYEQRQGDRNPDQTDEAIYLLRKHKQRAIQTHYYSLGECVGFIQPKKQYGVMTRSTLVVAMEQISFAKNTKVWNNFLQSHKFSQGRINFSLETFNTYRYGHNLSQAMRQTVEIQAINKIKGAIRRYKLRKDIKFELRRPGFKYVSGVIRMVGLALVYVLLASDDQKWFSLTLSERSAANTEFVVRRAFIKESVLEKAVRMTKASGGPQFILAAVSELFEEYIHDHCQDMIISKQDSKHKKEPKFARDWQLTLKRLLLDQICNLESDQPKLTAPKVDEKVKKETKGKVTFDEKAKGQTDDKAKGKAQQIDTNKPGTKKDEKSKQKQKKDAEDSYEEF